MRQARVTSLQEQTHDGHLKVCRRIFRSKCNGNEIRGTPFGGWDRKLYAALLKTAIICD